MPMKIHDKWYDMTGFKHPGGPIMLDLGEGRDATALFEAHHPFTSRAYLETILKAHETTEPGVLLDEADATQPYVWPEFESKDPSSLAHVGAPITPFAHELVAGAKAYLQTEAKRRGVPLLTAGKATPQRWLQLGVLLALYAATLPAFVRGELWTLVASPLLYWILGVNIMHDGSHFGLSRDWRVNMLATYYGLYFTSPLEWYHQHVIGHHAYPNIPHRDPDLYHNGMMERHTRTLRWRPVHAHQARTWYPIWVIGTAAMCFLKPLQMYLSGKYNRAVAVMRLSRGRWLQHLAGRLLAFFLCYLWPFLVMPAGRACLFAFVPIGLISVCFMASSQINHLSDENVDQFSDDYYKQQVLTSHTCAPDSFLTFLFTGGLNLQIEHHLFPTLNHCHLRALQPMVKAVCKKHGVPYHESPSLWVALGKYVKHLRTLSKKD